MSRPAFKDNDDTLRAILGKIDGMREATQIIFREFGKASDGSKVPSDDQPLNPLAVQVKVREIVNRMERASVQELVDQVEVRRPAPTRIDLERRAIERVLQGVEWSTAAEIGARRAPGAANPHGTISRWRDSGAVFGIDHGGRKIYPAYVFDASLQPLPAVRKVLEVFKGYEPFRIAAWFESTNAFLGGRRPREVIGTDPDAVVAAARAHRVGPVHG